MTLVPATAATGREIRLEWERFLSGGSDPSSAVRDPVLASWRRSQQCGVPADRLAVPYDAETDTESRLWWAAQPVLDDLAERLSGTSNFIVLGDSQGRIVHRWVLDPGLVPLLDRDFLAERFCLGEEHVGTNGVGSAVEERRPFIVAGPEHYKDAFHHWTCLGGPVFHPISRQFEGIIDLSCLYKYTNDLLLPLVVDAVRHVEDRLFLDASNAEQILLRHFLPLARSATRAVTAVSERTIITNPLAARLLEDVDQAMLWEHAARSMADHNEDFGDLCLKEGKSVAVRCTPIRDGTQLVGALLELRRETVPTGNGKRRRRSQLQELEGLAGKSKAWKSTCDEAVRRLNHGLPLLVTGEPGVGKLSLVHALCARSVPGSEPVVVDCVLEPVEGAPTWFARAHGALLGERPVVFRHLEALGPPAAAALSSAIDDALDEGRGHLFATLTDTGRSSAESVSLVERFAAGRVEVPPLRQRPEDIPELVSVMLRRYLDDAGPARFTSPALQLLMRGEWPQNVRQLENVVRAALSNRRGVEIWIDDLPRETRCRATRRRLSAIEQVELDAILAELERSGNNRTRAAAALGISRATLHRRLKSYGLELDRSAF